MTPSKPVDAPTASAPTRRVDASMSLLNELMQNPLDPGYKDAADRREAAGQPRATALRSPLLIITALLIGIMLITAAQVLRVPQDDASRQRDQLIDQIERKQTANDGTAREISGLRSQIRTAQDQALARDNNAGLSGQLTQAEISSGAVGVSGPGVQITLDDTPAKPGNGDAGSEDGSNTLNSSDIRVIVNGLWQAEAEAISINGQRLTAGSAIRFAGPAITIDNRPIARPYVISAIGEKGGLKSRFDNNPGGAYLKTLPAQVEVRVRTETKDRLNLPASVSVSLNSARPPLSSTTTTTKATPSTSTQEESP